MDDDLNFVQIDGDNDCGEVRVYALSTCGFCRKALKFLRDHSVRFSYVYIDELDRERKSQLKNDLAAMYNQRVGFPFIVINEEKVIVGFKEEELKQQLLR